MSIQMNDYIFETLLGNGSFGYVFIWSVIPALFAFYLCRFFRLVYLVRRKKDLKPFVVKQQALNVANTLSLKIALQEVRCLQSLSHPNIVGYHGAWVVDNYSYIVMEYATRCTIKDLLEKREVPLIEEDALYLFSQIVLGVHHIHSRKILHRDLKPENIMLTGSRGDIVKIGDFGVSKIFQKFNDNKMSVMCRAGSMYYMAPEVLLGHFYDFKCDVWSMGVILYEMITKKLPFPAMSLAEIVDTTCNQKPRPLPSGTSTSIVRLVSKMLMKQPLSRPNIDQLVLCPYLVPYIVRVYLNLGRTPCIADQSGDEFNADVFLKFLKPPTMRNTVLN